MFKRARLRIAGLYVVLLVLIVVAVAGSLVFLAAREARQTADLELRLRAEGIVEQVQRTAAAAPTPARRDDDDDDDDENGHDSHDGSRELQRAGLVAYTLPVENNRLLPVEGSGITGLPDADAAGRALAAGHGQFATLDLADGRVRIYSVMVEVAGSPTAVVQVARSQAFVDATVQALLLRLLVAALIGLVTAAAAGYWLAGRTLRPIAAALQRQRDFVADASHELRTPLAVIRGNVDHMRRFPDVPVREYDDVMEDLASEADRLSRLVSGLLTLARADDGRAQLLRTDVNLSEHMQALVRETTSLATARGLELRATIQPAVLVRGDADRLHELGMILLDNALRYTGSGYVALDLSATEEAATLRVADTGPGIAPEYLSRIFDRFYRTPAARSSDVEGTGLGLAIARWIAEAHGGRLTATSTEGQGSVFTFEMPRRAAERMDTNGPTHRG